MSGDVSGHSSARSGDTPYEKEELIGQILELQNTLQDLSQRVNSVKEENAKLKTENEVRSHKGKQCATCFQLLNLVELPNYVHG